MFDAQLPEFLERWADARVDLPGLVGRAPLREALGRIEALSRGAALEPPSIELDAVAHRILSRLEGGPGRLTESAFADGGPAHVFETLALARTMTVEWRDGRPHTVRLADTPGPWSSEGLRWLRARRAPGDHWIEHADSRWTDDASVDLMAALALLSPERPEWAVRAAEALLDADRHASAVGPVLGALRDPEWLDMIALLVLDEKHEKAVQPYLDLLTAELGPAAAPALSTMLEGCRHHAFREPLVRALTLAGGPLATELLIDEWLRPSGPSRGPARDHLATHRDAAPAVRARIDTLESNRTRKGLAARTRQIAALREVLAENEGADRSAPAWFDALAQVTRPPWLATHALELTWLDKGPLDPAQTTRLIAGLLDSHPVAMRTAEQVRGWGTATEAIFDQWSKAARPTRDTGPVVKLLVQRGERVEAQLEPCVAKLSRDKAKGKLNALFAALEELGPVARSTLAYFAWCGVNRSVRHHAENALGPFLSSIRPPTLGFDGDGRLTRDGLEFRLSDTAHIELETLAPPMSATAARRIQAPLDRHAKRMRRALRHRLEQAMHGKNPLGDDAVEQWLVGHPFGERLARRLVWSLRTHDGRRGPKTFRFGDRPTKRTPETTLAPIHPALLRKGERRRWARALDPASQPFPQLDRPVARLEELDLEALRKTSFRVPVKAVTKLASKGWRLCSYDPTKPRWDALEKRLGPFSAGLSLFPSLYTREQLPGRNPDYVDAQLYFVDLTPRTPTAIEVSELLADVWAMLRDGEVLRDGEMLPDYR